VHINCRVCSKLIELIPYVATPTICWECLQNERIDKLEKVTETMADYLSRGVSFYEDWGREEIIKDIESKINK
jgi:hypothetical protein